MAPLKAALLGIEHPHSLGHLRTLQQLPEVESIVLWDTNPDALAKVQAEQGAKVSGVFTDLDALLADPDLFFVIASVRNDLGPDLFIRALEAGKHLMAEKPIGRTAADTEKVVAAAQRKGLKLGVCYQNRWNPLIQESRRIVAEGVLGPLLSVEMRMITTQVRFRDPKKWLFSKEKAGGGILSWLGCHYIDMMRYVTQDEIVSVAAEVATRNGEDIDVEDVAVLSLRFRSGAVGSLHAGYMLALSGGGYFNPAGYDNYMGVNGRSGRITWSGIGAPTEMYVESSHPAWGGAPQRKLNYTLGASPAYGGIPGEQFVRRFIESAQGQGEPPTSGLDALAVARVVDAAYASSETGRRVEVATSST
jgi:predicted dehydrogenase